MSSSVSCCGVALRTGVLQRAAARDGRPRAIASWVFSPWKLVAKIRRLRGSGKRYDYAAEVAVMADAIVGG